MCSRFILAQKISALERRFNVQVADDFDFAANYNIGPGMLAPVILDSSPGTLQLLRFGLVPHWAKKPMSLINARAEGDRNKENLPEYNGSKDIITKPAFRKAIRSQRCLVPADAFIEGTTDEKLSKPFLVFLKNKVRPFAFAGIWDSWLNDKTGETINSFALITTASNSLMLRIPHQRCPLILQRRQEKTWLRKNSTLGEITEILKPYPAELMDAYPISPEIKSVKNNDKSFIFPVGEKLSKE